MTGMSPESRPDTTAIRARAEAATPGPWEAEVDFAAIAHGSDSVVHAWYSATCDVCSEPMEGDATVEVTTDDAAHIAGMDPTTTIALLDALDTAEGEAQRLRESSQWWKENRDSWAKGYEALVARIKALADKWDATTERVTGVAADHWRGRDFAEGVSLRTETLVDDLRAVLDGTDHTDAETCLATHPDTGNGCVEPAGHDGYHRAMGTQRMQIFGPGLEYGGTGRADETPQEKP